MFVNAFSVLKSICEFGGGRVPYMEVVVSTVVASFFVCIVKSILCVRGPDCDKGRKRRNFYFQSTSPQVLFWSERQYNKCVTESR
jgi:hypothetical protein